MYSFSNMKIAIAMAFFFSVLPVINAQMSAKPNLIFYLADDQDKYDYGCYGNEKIHTSAVDRLAREGLMFEQAFTAQAICAPSRSQLYTGNYPLKNGCFLNHIQVKSDQKAISSYLQELGYEVILAGKSHVNPASVFDWDRSWKPQGKEGAVRPALPLDSISSYFKQAHKPFCMFITSDYPHGPYKKTAEGESENFKFYPFNAEKKNVPGAIKDLAGYYLNVKEDNSQLELVLNWVDEYLDENTLFIYSADHGKSGKFTVYDRGLNVPFIVRWPGVTTAGSKTEVMIHYTDVLPTFIQIAGGSVPDDVDGKSFLQVLGGYNEEIHEYVYGVQSNQNILAAKVFPSRTIRSKKYKYIRNFNSLEVVENNYGDNEYVNAFIRRGAEAFSDTPFEELYDIENDPFELNNLAKLDKFSKVKETMVEEMYHWMKAQGDFLVKENYIPIHKPIHNRLDESSKYKSIPEELEFTLREDDYLILHY